MQPYVGKRYTFIPLNEPSPGVVEEATAEVYLLCLNRKIKSPQKVLELLIKTQQELEKQGVAL